MSARKSSPRLRAQRDKIREQENAVLDVFSQESFFKVLQLRSPHMNTFHYYTQAFHQALGGQKLLLYDNWMHLDQICHGGFPFIAGMLGADNFIGAAWWSISGLPHTILRICHWAARAIERAVSMRSSRVGAVFWEGREERLPERDELVALQKNLTICVCARGAWLQ